nr:ribonuclease H-like domain-containing protein [Tanacetum cinerariifolium]
CRPMRKKGRATWDGGKSTRGGRVRVFGTVLGTPQDSLRDQGYFDSGCSRHMTGNISYLTDFKKYDGGYFAFGVGAKCGKITGKGTIRTGKLDFEVVYFVKEL